MKHISLLILSILLCMSLIACVESDPSTSASTEPTAPELTVPTARPTDTQPKPTVVPTEPTQTEPTVPAIPVLDPDFSAMPQMYSDFGEIYMSEHFAVFTFVMPGMNDACTQVATYDLSTDTLLGQVDLGEGNVAVFVVDGDQFAVLDLNRAVLCVYDSSCSLEKEIVLPGVQAPVGMAGLNEHVLLVSEPRTGRIILCDLHTETAVTTSLPPDVYTFVGKLSNGFLLQSYNLGLVSVSTDGSYEVLYSKGYAEVVGSTYAAGFQGDYMTLLPLQGGDAVMVPSGVFGEIFLDADGAILLSRSQHFDQPDVLQYYDTASMTVRQVRAEGKVVDAALFGQYAVVTWREDYGAVLQYSLIDFSQCEVKLIHSLAYDAGILNGCEPLPAPTGSDEMVALIQRYETEYGVRILYEPDIFDVSLYGIEMIPCSEDEAYNRAVLLEHVFRFLPEGLLKEMGETWPVVIYLCENVNPSAGGMHTILNGYNVMFLSVTGHDDYFLNVAAHEMGHALDIGMDQQTLQGWFDLMPPEVLEAYENRNLTVEYTPDDKGRTPVWFADAYSRFSDREDRAVLFSRIFDAWLYGEDDYLQYEGLRIKANYWAEMLRITYESCKDYVFPWETAN